MENISSIVVTHFCHEQHRYVLLILRRDEPNRVRPFECVFFCFFFFLPPDGQKFNLRQEIAKHYRVSSPNNNPWRGACWSEEGGGGGRLQNFLIFLKRKASTLPSHAIQQFALFHLTQASFAVIYLSKMSNAFDIFF